MKTNKGGNVFSDNELVAEFMGLAHQLHLWECPITGNYIPEEELQYHCNWSWIMPVVERIEKMEELDDFRIETYQVVIYAEDLKGNRFNCTYYHNSYPNKEMTKIGSVYSAVTDFIKWYNQNK